MDRQYEDTLIKRQLLKKTYVSKEAGVLKWTIDYTPYNLSHPGATIVDTLDEGLALRLKADGTLNLVADNYALKKLTLKTDGSYQEGDVIPIKEGENLF